MFLRVLIFMTANAADFADIPFVAPTAADLQAEADKLQQLGAAKAVKTAASKDSTVTRGDARDDLRDDLEYVAEVWRSIPDETKGMENKFKLQPGNNDQTLAATGTAFADEAADPTVAAILTNQGIKRDFFTALRAKVAAFEAAVSEAESSHGERVGTNAAFVEPARRGKKLVNKLAPAVKRRYRADPPKLAEWLVASHVEKPPEHGKEEVFDADK